MTTTKQIELNGAKDRPMTQEYASNPPVHNKGVALFIDVDNVLILAQHSGLPFRLSLIVDKVREQGRIMTSKAYADWTTNLLRPFYGDFRVNAVELVQLMTSTASKEHKNTADIQLTVDAMEMVFSPVCPDVVVIVGGDRDYVPLVQKLRRYGIFVTVIGVESGVSRPLSEACDKLIYYDDLVPPAPEEAENRVSAADRAEVYSLMRRSVETIQREGRTATGASVHELMKQLSPAFNLERYQATFKELTWGAHESGYVILTEVPGSDFKLDTVSTPDIPVIQPAETASRAFDFSSIEAITASYRTIMQERRIPLLPWPVRKQFVELIWAELDERGDGGMSINEMRETLLDYAKINGLQISPQMIQKLLYSLNFARCFSLVKGAPLGEQISIPADLHYRLYSAVGVDEAIDGVHERYVIILAARAGILNRAAVFELLYGDVIDEGERESRSAILDDICERHSPSRDFAQALGQALMDGK